MKHFGIYDSAEDLQDALNAGAIENPYVALVDGDLDYNTMSPEEPSYIGEWSYDGVETYNFNLVDTDPALWENDTDIAVALGIGDNQEDMTVTLSNDGEGAWIMRFKPEGVEPSEFQEHPFTDGVPEEWGTGLVTNVEDSDSQVIVDYDGDSNFEFYSGSANSPLSLTTINPEAPAGE